jgi:multicomponent Na+:H+ antiporter subunit E
LILPVRLSAFLILWLVLDGVKPAGLLIGMPAAALSAWINLLLFPPSRGRPRLMALLSLGWHFLWSSVVAGVDVAIRAFHPRLPLRTGFVTCECGILAGPHRDLFLSVALNVFTIVAVSSGAFFSSRAPSGCCGSLTRLRACML